MPMTMNDDVLAENIAKFSRLSKKYEISKEIRYSFGTAGFRMDAGLMLPVALRTGLLAALISTIEGGAIIGVILTASHNPVNDNGIKLVAANGAPIESKWEIIAEKIANLTLNELSAEVEKLLCTVTKCTSRIVVGRDTRPSGPELIEAIKQGASLLGAQVYDLEFVTTPELHTGTARLNRWLEAEGVPRTSIDADQMEDLYLTELAEAFSNALDGVECDQVTEIFADCANGVGANKIARLAPKLPQSHRLHYLNNGSAPGAILNHECGADYIKTNVKSPKMIPEVDPQMKYRAHFASLDGDADRVVYFYFDQTGNFHLLDGDRIAVLAAIVITRLMASAGLGKVKVGVVQTAYANGGSTRCLETLPVELVCTSTGVKYLHQAAHDYPVGIYFESNGHGTILFQPSLLAQLEERHRFKRCVASKTLLDLAHLANQFVGDAIADMLLVEVLLLHAHLTLADWDALYPELPSRILKVAVKDRTAMVTTDADRRIIKPIGLQVEIDEAASKVNLGRSFARPSGTENVVRVFAEAPTIEAADELAENIVKLVQKWLI